MEIDDIYFRGEITINLDAICENMINLKKKIKPGTKVAAVIKTDGYGHGAVPVAYALDNQVDFYAVATMDEALNLRKNGLTKPILIIGYTPDCQIGRCLGNDIRPTVFTLESAAALSESAKKMGETAKIHIKVDTGMSRIGFKCDSESIEIIKKISELENIEIEGIFTHFAAADELDKSKAKAQYDKFTAFVDEIEKNGVHISIKHCSNSAGMMELDYANMDMVRAGIAMYGLYPSEEVDKNSVKLTPALSMKSHVVFVKKIPENTEVSYGGTFVSDKEMTIATIPVGYGDGYKRSLSNKGYVLINGKKANILGRVCMDQFMVDVTDIRDVSIGTEVTLIGTNGNEEISVEKMAEIAGETFNYEIVCDLGKRLPRVYVKNGKIVCTKDYFDDIYNVNI